jgi:adenylate cyclase
MNHRSFVVQDPTFAPRRGTLYTLHMQHGQRGPVFSFFRPEIPERIGAEFHAWYRSLVIGAYLIFFAHVLLVFAWWFAGVREMVYYHIVSFTLLGAAAVLVQRGRLLVGLSLATVEILLHAVLGTLYAGWESGFHMGMITAAIVWAAHPGRSNANRRFVGLAIIVLHIFFLVAARTRPPVYTIPDWYLTVSSAIMLSFICIPLLLLVVLQAVSAGWYTSLQEEREKSERLLLNVLPATIATRLKESDQIIADRFDNVSVLFLDIVDFTTLSASMNPAEVVSILNELFSRFDALTEQSGLEKIKTIGDAYMAVAGVPDPHHDHARRAVNLAIAMLTELQDYTAPDGTQIKARIGICSGPVVAGVIGRRKFIYDLWGDTVNTASRMESHGVCNQIQVTESTYRILHDDYPFMPRGSVEIKGKGPMSTYLLDLPGEMERPIASPAAR